MDAVKCDDAAIAAADGSSDELSCNGPLPKVGEGIFGADPSHNFLVENFRESPPEPDLSVLISGGGVVRGCSGFGKGCDLSLAWRMMGNVSSRSFRFSSTILFRSSLSTLSSDSAAIMR